MNDLNFVLSVLFILVILQSIVGVGILVIGTPFLLILGFDIVATISILLPISIATSFINLIFFKINKKKFKMKIDSSTKNLFFFVCIPSIFVGVYFLEILQNTINFKYCVSIVIIVSIILTTIKKFILKMDNKIKNIFLSTIGIIHGLTNSGGTLLSLFMTSHLGKNNSRYGITFFYFFLALCQYLIFNYFFETRFFYIGLEMFLVLIPLGVFLGNYLIKFVDEEKFKKLIIILSFVTCIFLISK